MPTEAEEVSVATTFLTEMTAARTKPESIAVIGRFFRFLSTTENLLIVPAFRDVIKMKVAEFSTDGEIFNAL